MRRTTRVRNGVREALFGGYATWFDRSGKYRRREVRAWGPSNLADDDCGPGTAAVVKLLLAAARRVTRMPVEVNESWRY